MPSLYPNEVAQLTKLYRTSMEEVSSLVTEGTAFQRGRTRVLIRKVSDALRPLDRETAKWAGDLIPRAYDRGAADVVKGLRNIGYRGPLSTEFVGVHERAVEAIARSVERDLGRATRRAEGMVGRVLRRTQQAVVKEEFLNTEVGKALVKGAPRRELSRALRGLFDRASDREGLLHIADGQFVRAGSKWVPLDYYCELVARTATRQATVQGTIDRLSDNGLDLVVVVGPRDTCEICQEFVGQVYSISGRSEKYPSLAEAMGGPPYHPNCEHGLGAFVEGLSRLAA